ncbi:MAG: hypothetical protein FJ044_04795 [Candidatus Cloacimonetes bacterium]|nr:hypothetical protein [Candidatus Cloacimonadota bacterium]
MRYQGSKRFFLDTLDTLYTLRVSISKRQKFISLSFLLTFFLWFLPPALPAFVALSISLGLTFLVTLYALDFDLRFPEHLIFPIYPMLLAIAVLLHRPETSQFSFLLIFYTLAILFTFYLLFLTLNILNIATVRTVPLKKAALSTLYFVGLIIGFFNIKGVLQLHPSNFSFFIFHFSLNVALTLPLIYSIQIKPSPIEEEISPKPKILVPEILVLGLLSSEIALVASFLKTSPISLATFLAGILFLLISITQHIIKKTLTKKIIWEHAAVGVSLIGVLIISSFSYFSP